jgi:nucleotide-binding universal stress UspA family protein
MGRLVVGDDSSARADVVWLWVNNHRWPGWLISVVTARPPAEWTPLPPERTHLHPWEPPHPRAILAGGTETRVEHLLAEADPRIVLDSVPDATLVAIGPHGGNRLGLHIGSTAEWLLHRPTTPLVVIRSARPTRRVLVCTDGSSHARRAAEAAATLPWIGQCEVRVLAVRTGSGDVDGGVADAVAALRAGGAEPTALILDREAYPAGHGDVRGLLLEEMTTSGTDLVALGTAGSGGWRRAVLGSTASAIVHRAPCSVLVAFDAGD